MDPISLFIIGLLLSIIGYLIVEGRITQKETNTKLFSLIEKNTEVVRELKTTIELIQQSYEDHKVICNFPNTQKSHQSHKSQSSQTS